MDTYYFMNGSKTGWSNVRGWSLVPEEWHEYSESEVRAVEECMAAPPSMLYFENLDTTFRRADSVLAGLKDRHLQRQRMERRFS